MQKSSTKFYKTQPNNILKRSYIMIKWALSQGCKDSSIFANQSMWYTTLTNWKIKPYNYLNRCRESLWQNSTSIYDKNPPESRNRRNIPQHNKSYIWQTHSKHYPQWWKIKSISSKIKMKEPLSPRLFNIVLEAITTAVRKLKKQKEFRLEKKQNFHCLQMTWSST